MKVSLNQTFNEKRIDQIIESAMMEWNVPGVALGVIKDGKIIYVKAYGYRDVENKLPVTSKTVMMIASNTKSFTSLMMAKLVEEEKVKWDDPVSKYLPEFQLKDAYATKFMTVKDLLMHNSGLPRHDFAWLSKPDETAKDLLTRLPFLEPSVSFRQKFQYQNFMYTTASYLQEKVTGKNWHDLMRESFFVPLNMTSTSSTIEGLKKSEDVALGYAYEKNKLVMVPYRRANSVAGAGSINSNIEDMLKYVQFRLNLGQVDGKQLISEQLVRMTQSPQISIDDDEGYYGLGVSININYLGQPIVNHAGGIDGFTSDMVWLPNTKAGVVVLTNSTSALGSVVKKVVVDELIGASNKKDWLAEQKESERIAKEELEKQKTTFWQKQVQGTKPSHQLADYVGTYENPGYGRVKILEKAGKLLFIFDEFSITLAHYHYDFFTAPADTTEPISEALLTADVVGFKTNTQGAITAVTFPFEPSLPEPIEFTRVKVNPTENQALAK